MKISKLLGNPLPKLEEKHIRFAFFILVVIALLITLLTIIMKNYEFAYYAILSWPIIFIFYRGRKRTHLHAETVQLVTIFIFLHFLGGAVNLNGARLYDSFIFNVRYDNYMHFIGLVLIAFAAYDFFIPYLKKSMLERYRFFTLLLICSGIGALVEIFEFIAVNVLMNTGVGDYFNNAMDLVSNLVGSVFGILMAHYLLRKKRKLKC